jgi:hypothetical protein
MRSLAEVFRTATAAAVALAIMSLLAHDSSNAEDKKSSAPARDFYLTKETVDGSHALTACAAGFHMAAMGEIREASTLRYDIVLGRTADDSGFGPPVGAGWIRSGMETHNSLNCNLWTSNSAVDSGFVALYKPVGSPTLDWILHLGAPCNGIASGLANIGVWCVQD